MYILIGLFFISLAGIATMIGRKLALVKNGKVEVVEAEHAHPFVPDLEKIKHLTKRNARAYSYAALVGTIRAYVKTSNVLKNKYQETKNKIRDLGKKKVNPDGTVVEENRFLRKISDYKYKIREIKHKIHEEEKSY